MSRAPRKTKRLRVKLDFVVELKEPTHSAVAVGGKEDWAAMLRGIFNALKHKPELESICAPTSMQVSLDYRPVKP